MPKGGPVSSASDNFRHTNHLRDKRRHLSFTRKGSGSGKGTMVRGNIGFSSGASQKNLEEVNLGSLTDCLSWGD